MGIGANISDVGAGALRELFAFDQRITIDDGYGNTQGEWHEVFRAATGRVAFKGGEAVQASRLEGRQPHLITIRNSTNAALLTPDWRCRDTRTGKAYAIVTHDVRPRKDYVDMIVTEGIADAEAPI